MFKHFRFTELCTSLSLSLWVWCIHLVGQHQDVDRVEEGAEDADHHGEVAVDGLVGILK